MLPTTPLMRDAAPLALDPPPALFLSISSTISARAAFEVALARFAAACLFLVLSPAASSGPLTLVVRALTSPLPPILHEIQGCFVGTQTLQCPRVHVFVTIQTTGYAAMESRWIVILRPKELCLLPALWTYLKHTPSADNSGDSSIGHAQRRRLRPPLPLRAHQSHVPTA